MHVEAADHGPSEAIGHPHPAEPAILQRLKTAASKNQEKIVMGQPHNDFLAKRGRVSHGILGGATIAFPFVPLNPKILDNEDEAENLLKTAGASVVIVQEASHCHVVDSMQDNGWSFRIKIVVSSDPPGETWTTFATMLEHDSSSFQQASIDRPETHEELIAILLTRGTASRPKGVPHTNTTINAFCRNLSLGGCSPSHIFCSVLPNNHAMGFFFPLHYLMHGGTVVFASPSFDSRAMIKALGVERVTHTDIVPTILHALIDTIETRNTGLDSSLLDVCLSGGSVTPENVRRHFQL